MNLFQKYGIKEVADVVFYSINKIGDEEFYTPVLFLDTLKVSTIEKTAEKVEARGGLGNKKLITWNFGKEIILNLEDALFSPASMSMIWGGKLDAKLSPYTSAIVKCNMANKYGELHYSTKAYPSPALTDEEWRIVFSAAQDIGYEVTLSDGSTTSSEYGMDTKEKQFLDEQPVNAAESRNILLYQYFNRTKTGMTEGLEKEHPIAIPQEIVNQILTYITELKDVGYMDTEIYNIEVIDRWEKCIVKKKEGQEISLYEQKKNLGRYYRDDRTSSYTIFYDAKTMLPLLPVKDGKIQEVNGVDFTGADAENKGVFKIKMGTIYYKWTRTVKYKESEDDAILGRTFVIDADTFPDNYRIVGETYIRNQKTGKDQRYQFTIFRANVSTDTNITLEAEGDPTTFSMSVDVLVPPNDIMMELKQYDVEDDLLEGGTRIVPTKSTYSYTPYDIDMSTKTVDDNLEIY